MLSAVVLLALVSPGLSADWYLANTALGENDGTSWTNAWNRVSDIDWSVVNQGDTLWIRGGNYSEHLNVLNKSGLSVMIDPLSAQKAVFLGGQLWNVNQSVIDGLRNGEPYICFRGTSSAGKHGYYIRNSHSTIIRGIEVDRSQVYVTDTYQHHGIAIADDSKQVTVTQCYIHDTSGDGININAWAPVGDSYDNFVVERNRIWNVGDDGIQAAHGNVTIANNDVDKNRFPTMFGGHPDGFQLNPNQKNVVVAGNLFRGFNQNIFIEWATGNVYVYNNVLVGVESTGTDRGITCAAKEGFSGTWLTANNTFVNFVSYYAILGTFPSGAKIGNNLFVNCRLIASSGSEPFLDISNIYWDEPGVTYYDTNGNPIAIPADRDAGASRYEDPKLVDVETADVRLTTGSPAIDTGRNFASYFSTDRAGSPRGAQWDVGAYEYPVDGAGADPPSAPANLRISLR
jgi:hypothetical protein